jgi:hypothetical protein
MGSALHDDLTVSEIAGDRRTVVNAYYDVAITPWCQQSADTGCVNGVRPRDHRALPLPPPGMRLQFVFRARLDRLGSPRGEH